jgi:hypothetical protein
MDNNEEIYRLVGKLVLDAHFSNLGLNARIKELYSENSKLQEQLRIIQELQGNEPQ